MTLFVAGESEPRQKNFGLHETTFVRRPGAAVELQSPAGEWRGVHSTRDGGINP